MSTKHLRRLIEEKEQQEAKTHTDEESEPTPPRNGPVNRFAAFVASEEEGDADSGEDGELGQDTNQVLAQRQPCVVDERRMTKKKKRKQKKKKKDVEEIDDDLLLDQLAFEKCMDSTNSKDCEPLRIEQILKVDPRLFDAAAELKKTIGRNFKETGSSTSRPHRGTHSAGRLVKRKMTWPPIRSIGLSMELDRVEKNVKWFKFTHNSRYEELERLCWLAEDSSDHRLIEDILSENPYHLNSLLLLANIFRMQEDITQSCDIIERGIYYCEQAMASTFQPCSYHHRVDYLDYENRAFYLLLHRHMLNCIHKRCFETALNYAKLILTMDVARDPLAVILIIDTIALKAKQYKWLRNMHVCCRVWKNLDLLPNFRYSLALARFLEANSAEDLEVADGLLADAICAFPAVVPMILDKLQVEPDALVETHRYLGTFAVNKLTEGLRMVLKIYVNQTAELWKVPETLSWLEHVTRQCLQMDNCQTQMALWDEKCKRLFVGTPPNVRRLAVLLGLEASSYGVTNPVPPVNGRARNLFTPRGSTTVATLPMQGSMEQAIRSSPRRYTRNVQTPSRPDSFVSGFFHSIWPDYAMEQHLSDALRGLTDRLQALLSPTRADRGPSLSSDNDDEDDNLRL